MKNKFLSQEDVRWCPGCGDYAVLKYLSEVLEAKQLDPKDVVVVSGIGCSSRMPYYLSCYGFHTIHGRAPTIATGIALANPKLHLIVITGDGDGCSIGLHHLLHTFRRNLKMTILLLNNRIYGLTKGQTSPTSIPGQRTKTDLDGVQIDPMNPLNLALVSGGTWLGRCFDIQGLLMKRLISSALDHPGTALLEIYQRCPIFDPSGVQAVGLKEISVISKTYWAGEDGYIGEKQDAFALLDQHSFYALGLLYVQQRAIFTTRYALSPSLDKALTPYQDRINSLLRWEQEDLY